MKWSAGEEAAGRQADSLPLGEGRRAAIAQRAEQVCLALFALFIGGMPSRRSPAGERGPLTWPFCVCAGGCCGWGPRTPRSTHGTAALATRIRRFLNQRLGKRVSRRGRERDPTPETILAKFGRRAAGSLAFLFWTFGFLIRQRQWLLYRATKSSGGIYEMSASFSLNFRAKALNRWSKINSKL
jgi:hypothetical protein